MDKSPEGGLEEARRELAGHSPSVVACSDPLHKAGLLARLAGSSDVPVSFVDLDLLHSGYVVSGMLRGGSNVTVLRPDGGSWRGDLARVISRASGERSLVIVDSLNGLHGMLAGPGSARFVDSCLMLLASAARQAGSSVIVSAMARRREDGTWTLFPGGRRLPLSSRTGLFHVGGAGGRLVLSGAGGSRIDIPPP